MQRRNVIRFIVAVTALGTLAISVGVFHAGGSIQVAGGLARASGVALALVIASLGLEVGRAVGALAAGATGQAALVQGFQDNLERDVGRVRKLRTLWQNVACAVVLSVLALVWYFGKHITGFIFGTPDTRFMVMSYERGIVGVIYVWTLFPAIYLADFVSLLLSARAYPLAAAQVASEEKFSFQSRGGGYWSRPMSRTTYFRLLSAFLTGCLLADLLFAVSYARFTDQGIGVVDFPGTTEVFHQWNSVISITEAPSHGRGGPLHGYTIRFSDGSEWIYDSIPDDGSNTMRPDPAAAVTFAASRAKMPIHDQR